MDCIFLPLRNPVRQAFNDKLFTEEEAEQGEDPARF